MSSEWYLKERRTLSFESRGAYGRYTQGRAMPAERTPEPVLERILAETRRVVAERKGATPSVVLEAKAARHRPRGFAQALRARAASGRPAILAEIKKASPSRGVIRADFDPPGLAAALEQGGAAALSILTDESFFQGHLSYLQQASSATALPCLRKDFIVDPYQILEARAHCADAILLIAAALPDDELVRLTGFAHELDLDVLCEVHTGEELARVQALGADAYGVNNRNLATFEVTLETSLALAARLPEKAVRVAESGLSCAADILRLQSAGYQAFLIGESLMRRPEPGRALAELLEACSTPSPSGAGCV